MPRYSRLSPESANIFDNLHMLHGIAYDTLAYDGWSPRLPDIYNIHQETLWLPAPSLAAHVIFPTNDESDGVDTVLKVILSKTVGRGYTWQRVHLNVSWHYNSAAHEKERENFFVGLLRWASDTIRTIRESSVSAPTFSACMTREPVALMRPVRPRGDTSLPILLQDRPRGTLGPILAPSVPHLPDCRPRNPGSAMKYYNSETERDSSSRPKLQEQLGVARLRKRAPPAWKFGDFLRLSHYKTFLCFPSAMTPLERRA